MSFYSCNYRQVVLFPVASRLLPPPPLPLSTTTAPPTPHTLHRAARRHDARRAEGKERLPHEVAHTVQQNTAAPVTQAKKADAVPAASSGTEREADDAAPAMMAGDKATVTPVAEQAHYNFTAYTDEHTIVDFLRVLEEVGVGAYTGAGQFIKGKGILTVAGGIQQVEARHTAILRRQNGMAPVPNAFEKVLTPDMVLAAAKPILGA